MVSINLSVCFLALLDLLAGSGCGESIPDSAAAGDGIAAGEGVHDPAAAGDVILAGDGVLDPAAAGDGDLLGISRIVLSLIQGSLVSTQ